MCMDFSIRMWERRRDAEVLQDPLSVECTSPAVKYGKCATTWTFLLSSGEEHSAVNHMTDLKLLLYNQEWESEEYI